MPLHLRFPARSTSLLIVAGLLAILAAGTAIALQGGGGDRAIDPDGTTCFGRTPTIVGTDANDGLLKGTDGPDVIIAARGADDVDAGGGNDLICLRGEGDRTDAGDGNDRVRGGGGEDTIFGGNGNDDLRGGRDDDQIFGDAGNDNIDGRHGDDGCTGGAGHDDIANCEGHAVGERNRAPVAVNDSDSSDENSPKTISVLANDTDPDSDPLHVASVATTGTHGTVAINGDGTLAYDPNHQFESLGAAQSAHDTFTYKATDGALESDPATVDVTVNGVNDAPVVSGLESGQLNHLTGSPASTLTSALDLADVDDSNLEGATVSIGAGLDSAHDALTFTDQLGITGTYNSGTGVLTLTGSAPVADYRTALRSVGFRSTVGGTGGNRSIAFRVSDGTDQSNSQARSLYVDNPPTNIALSPASVAENQPSGTTVGNLTSTDPEPDTQTYSLVSGAGSTDNGSFSISGAALKTGASFDFEIKSSYSVRVRSDDGHGGSFEKQLTINVTDANDAPTNVALSNASVNENQAPGAAVGNFSTTDQDLPAQSFTYTLVAGTGSTDNGSFQIAGNQLQSNAMFDKETKGTYDIRVRTTDNGSPNQNFEKQFTITIGDVNDAPTNLALSPSSIPENQPTNTTVGTLSTTDQDLPGDTFNYTEVTGTGDNDNADFTIVGNQVRTVPQFDFETKSSYTIRVQTDDNHGGTFAKAVPISITNANEQPTDIQLSSNSIPENSGAGATIGNLSTTDVDAGDTFTYTKVSGVGATDNGSFTISGNQLKAGPDFNFEVKNSYSVRLRSTDSGNAFTEKQFTISVTDVNDTPSDIALSNNSVAENTAQGTNVGNLSSTDEDLPPQTFTYTLVSGAGSTDNNDFQITGGALEVKNPLNFEAGATRSVRIRTTDNGAPNRNFEKAFTINVTNANDTPTDIALSNSSVAENTAQGTDVGNLSTTDQDTADTFTYTLVAGAGSTDNGDFQINGSTLEVKNPLNFEAGATRSVRIRTTDNGTGNLTFEKPFSITITNVNDAPTDIALNDTTTVEHSPQGTGIGTFSTTDEDTPAQTFTYSFATGNGINDADNGKFQITGNQLEHNATDLSVGTYSIFVRSTDSGSPAEHFDKQFTITVNPPNAAPVVDLDSATGGNDSTASFTEDSPAVSIEPNATVTDADNANLQSAEVKITNLQNGASESLSATVGGTGINATYTPGTGTLALTNTATVAQYEQVLKTVKYDNTSNTPGTTARAIEVKAFDGIDNSITHTATVSVAANNDAPVNSVPGAQTTNEDTSKTLSTANANAISISDVDAGGSDVKLTLSVSNGTLTLADTTGLTFTGGTANGQASLIFTGTISAINAALGNGLTYQPNANFNTSDTLAVTTDDQGNTGGGGAKTDSDNVTLNITADNDAPNTTVPGAQSVDEDTDLTFNTANSNLISTVDVDANPDDIRVTLAATNGKMTLATTAGLTPPINDGTSNVTVEGTVAEVNAALDGMKYRGNLNYFGSDTLSVNTTDLGHNPAPAKTDSDSVAITVNPVNDAPVADDENFNGANSAVGNTTFVGNSPGDGAPSTPDPTDTSPVTDRPHKTISGDILAGDTDVDDPTSSLTVSSGTVSSANAPGTNNVTIEPDGDFTFEPEPSASCTDPTDSFDYTVSDGHLGTTDTGTVTIALSGCVWYVNNDDAQGDGGTSEKPFNTLAQAETASGNNHSTFVYDGNNTSSGYDTGITLNSGEKLIGEAADLIAGTPAATLHSADAANRPTLTDTTADVVELDDGNEVKGLGIDPEGGGGIFGGSGDVAGTIDDVVINDAGIAATQPGLELNTTTGTWNISNLDVDVKNGATGVQLLNAGTVNFAPSGTISISSIGGKALGASSTNMGAGSEFDDLTATGSSAGGVTMTSTSGTTSLGNGSANDLALATTGGTAAALELTNAGTVNVPGAGTSNLSATNAGPAIDVQGTTVTALSFDDVDSSNSASDGIRLSGLGTGTFAANSNSTIDGASGAAVNVSGGSGAITFPGTINNGPGTTASISGRTGGSVTLSGPITETGDADAAQENGGVVLSGNSGGSTDITNATKTFNTGEDHAILMGTSDGHTLNITNGTLDIDTTSGKGIEATTSGTLNVTGSGNTIDTGSGKGLNVTNTDVGAANPLTFQSISGNGANAGILLNNTGSNNALTVVSTGSGTCDPTGTSGCTGGTITNTTGGDDSGSTPVGTAVVLKDTKGVSLTRVHLSNNSNYGIRGTTVNGLTLANTVINGTNGTSALTANKDSSSRFDNLTGTVSVTNTEMSGGYVSNFLVNNTAGSLSSTMTNFKSGTLDATGGDDAVQVEGLGTASVDVTMTGSTITTATGDLFQYDADGTGGGDLVFTGNALTNNEPSIAVGGGGVALTGGATGPATLDIENSSFRDSLTNAITIIKSRDNSGGSGNFSGTINNNQIGVAATPNSGSVEGDGMEITNEGHGNMTLAITNNIIRQYNSSGMQFVAGGGIADTGQFNLNISGNTIGNPGTTPTITLLQGIRIDSGVTAGDTFATCANFGANAITGSSDAANKDFRLVVNQNTTIRLPGYGGAATDGAAVAAFVAGKVGGGAQGTAVANAPGTFTGTGATCP